MKKGLLLSGFVLCMFTGFAQNQPGKTTAAAKAEDEAPYKKDPRMPDFSILLAADSSWFTRSQVPEKYNHVFIIYFAPDCGHCQHEAKEIVSHMDSLKNAFFVFVAYKPLEDIRGFATYYGLDKFDNVRIGRDPKYFIPAFYRVKFTPFIVAYKKGLLEKVFDPETGHVPEATELISFVNGN
ncbi:MAG: hypothetical protein V4450_02000 [Bacteroidota bacterium]